MTAYYNENDPKAAAWLRELIFDGQIAWGDVDERSIEDVLPSELAGYTQCHFFAGIGGWSYALRLAGWPDDRAVWTGSCPCQPFSQAGKGGGFADERHLWPAFYWLVSQHHPPTIFGEQVASPAGLCWFDLVSTDLEAANHAVGAVDICAAGLGAPHIRQRLYWYAEHYGMADNNGFCQQRVTQLLDSERPAQRYDINGRSSNGDMAVAEGQQQHGRGYSRDWRGESSNSGVDGNFLGHAGGERLEGWSVPRSERGNERAAWTPSDFVWCRDGKWRPVEPGTFPLAHGIPGRVGLLRGYGNAIVPQVAAAFIGAYLDAV